MIRYLLRRSLTMAVTLLVISALVFFIIKLPPGDFLTNQIAELRAQGEAAAAAKAEFLIRQYGLDRPVWEQYLVWIGVWPGPNGFSGLLQGDWGWSFEYDRPVTEVVGDALWLTLLWWVVRPNADVRDGNRPAIESEQVHELDDELARAGREE